MPKFYKCTRPDGTDFQTGTIDYGAALLSGEIVTHPARPVKDDASTYLSVSVEPADCTSFTWPCRLFRVEPVGRTLPHSDLPNKRACKALRVVEELPAHMAFGPNGEAVVAFIERCRTMTAEQARSLYEARVFGFDAALLASWDASWVAARVAAGDAARYAAWCAARYAARAIVVRDLITPEQYGILVRPFVDAGLGEWVA